MKYRIKEERGTFTIQVLKEIDVTNYNIFHLLGFYKQKKIIEKRWVDASEYSDYYMFKNKYYIISHVFKTLEECKEFLSYVIKCDEVEEKGETYHYL